MKKFFGKVIFLLCFLGSPESSENNDEPPKNVRHFEKVRRMIKILGHQE